MHITEKMVTGKRDPDLEWEEDFRVSTDREQQWKEV